MAELARGNVADRPWGRTFATLGLRGVTGQLTVLADGKRFLVGFDHGAVVAAASPLASDAAVRVALTSHLVSSSQVPEIARRQAAAPQRDEVELIAELARLGPDHALRLRRRVIAQRAARTFSVNQGEFVVTDRVELPVLAGCELDVRAVVYLGARNNLSEQRLSAELEQLGGWFQLRPGLDDDLPQFGFSDVEQPVIERLRDGGTPAEIEAFASSFVDGSTVRAVIYSLAACNACAVEPGAGQPRTRPASRPAPAPASTAPLPRLTESTQPMALIAESTQPMLPIAGPGEPAPRTTTRPLTRSAAASGSPGASVPPPPPDARSPQPPTGGRPGAIPPIQAARPATMPLGQVARPATSAPPPADAAVPKTTTQISPPPADTAVPKTTTRVSPPPADTAVPKTTTRVPPPPADTAVPKTTTRVSTAPPPPPRPPPPPGSARGVDASAWRDPDAAPPAAGERSRRDLPARGPTDDATGWDVAGGPRAVTRDAVGRDRSSGALRLPPDDAVEPGTSARARRLSEQPREWSSSASIRLPPEEAMARDIARTRRLSDEARERGSSGSIRLPGDEATAKGSTTGRIRPPSDAGMGTGSSGSIREPGDDARRRAGSSGSIREPGDDARRRAGSSGSIRVPGEEAMREGGSGVIRMPGEDAMREGGSGVIRVPGEEAMREGGSGVIRVPGEEAMREGGSGVIRVPGEEAMRDGSLPGLGRPGDDRRRRPGSSPGLRAPLDRGEAGPGLVLRPVVAARPSPARQIAQVDSPQAHGVKALIAQRLKLLDQGADHFQLLGVTHDVAAEPLRKAYFALARQLHPDRLAALGISDDGKHAQRLFAQINTGFAILSDRARRMTYLDVLRRGGEAAVRAEQARAEELTRRILEAEEAFQRGELALRRDQPQAAVAELQRAVQLHPEEADYHAALAWSRFCAAPDRAAVAAATRAALDRAIQRAPRSVTARFYLGRVERMLGRDQDALRHFRDVLAASPAHAEAASEVRALEARLSGGGDRPGGSGRKR